MRLTKIVLKIISGFLINTVFCLNIGFGFISEQFQAQKQADALSPQLIISNEQLQVGFAAAYNKTLSSNSGGEDKSVFITDKSPDRGVVRRSIRFLREKVLFSLLIAMPFLFVIGFFQNSQAAQFHAVTNSINKQIEYRVDIEKGDNLWDIAGYVYRQAEGIGKGNAAANLQWKKIFSQAENQQKLKKRPHNLTAGKEKVLLYPGESLIIPGKINQELAKKLAPEIEPQKKEKSEPEAEHITGKIKKTEPAKQVGTQVKTSYSEKQNVLPPPPPPKSKNFFQEIDLKWAALFSFITGLGIFWAGKRKNSKKDFLRWEEDLNLNGFNGASNGEVPRVKQYWAASCEVSQNTLWEWRKSVYGEKEDFSSQEVSGLLNKARTVINSTPFKIKEADANINQVSDIYEQATILSLRTLERILLQLKSADRLSAEEKNQLFYKAKEFKNIAQYCNEYSFALDCLNNLKIISGYVLPAEYIWEKFRFLPILRYLFGMKSGAKRSERQLREQAEKIFDLGNKIESGLYNDQKKSQQEIQEYVDAVHKGRNKTKLGYDRFHGWILRKMLGRFITIMSVVMFIVNALPLFFMYPGNIGFFSILWRSGLTLGSIFISWWFLGRGKKRVERLYADKQDFLLKVDKQLQEVPISPQVLAKTDIQKQMWMQEAEYVLEAADNELFNPYPSADVVIFMTGSDSQRTQAFRKKVFGPENEGLWRNDVPVVFLDTDCCGSAIGYIFAWEYLSSPQFAQIKKDYPGLNNKNIEDITAVVIMAGKTDISRMVSDISPEIEFNERRLRCIDWALFNGYRAAQKLKSLKRTGVVCFNADGVYVGPIEVRDDITLLGSWTSYKEMIDQQLGLMLAADQGRLGKIYEKFNISNVKNWLLKDIFLGIYDLDNTNKRQMLSFTGGIIASFEERETMKKFMDLLSKTYDYVRKINEERLKDKKAKYLSDLRSVEERIVGLSSQWEIVFEKGRNDQVSELNFRISELLAEREKIRNDYEDLRMGISLQLVPDFLVPLVMMKNGENIFTYLATRKVLQNKAMRDIYGGLFEVYLEWSQRWDNPVSISANVPYHAETSYYKSGSGPEAQDAFPFEINKQLLYMLRQRKERKANELSGSQSVILKKEKDFFQQDYIQNRLVETSL